MINKYRKFFPEDEIPSLFPYQEKVIQILLHNENALTIVPTGGGKSLVYYLAGLELSHTTIVISPLKALMQEQVNELNARGIKAISLTSDIGFQEQRKILRNLKPNEYKFIYVSPERLQDLFFKAALRKSKINIDLIVIDEAHCISQWGHDFRPEYGQIHRFIAFLKESAQSPTILALTATLSKRAIQDIQLEYGIDTNVIFSSENLIRQELKLSFKQVENKTAEDDKWKEIVSFLRENNSRKALVYLYSKPKSEELADRFENERPLEGLKADYFHAELDDKSKKFKYDMFKSGNINVLFTTTAFGMGMNIPDIDTVIQYHLPKSIEEYYQQVGRGARVKRLCPECNCLLLYSEKNIATNRTDYERERFCSDKINTGIDHLASNKGIGLISSVSFSALKKVKINISVLRYYLEKMGLIEIVGEIHGGPESIRFYNDTEFWLKVKGAAKGNSLIIAAKQMNIALFDIIEYIFSQDLNGNVEYLPAMDKKIYIKTLFDKLPQEAISKIINDNDDRIDYQIERFNELVNLINSPNPYEYLKTIFKDTV